MTEEDWHFDPTRETFEGYAWDDELLSPRKRYLYFAAVGRVIFPLMTEPACIRAVEACEAFADGLIDVDTFSDANDDGQRACGSSTAAVVGDAANNFPHVITDDSRHLESMECAVNALGYAAAVRAGVLQPNAFWEEARSVWDHPACLSGREAATKLFTQVMHDVFGPNPFRPVAFDPDWRTGTVVSLARQMYESRDFSLMPILADALQDTGCEHADILAHCRGDGPHVRGCWVVDLILGKS